MARRMAMASDHRGVALKRVLRERLAQAGFEVMDFGTDGEAAVDYPDVVGPAAESVSRGDAERGIVICGSGLGVTYTANRFPHVRAALAMDPEMAAMSRRHNDANVLALGADRLDPEAAWKIVETWLATSFEGGRHVARVQKIDTAPRHAWEHELGSRAPLADVDPEIAPLLRAEAKRQALGIELIASENFVSEAVLEAVGSVLTNKYAEGYPGRRYYGGCEDVDQVEEIAITRAKALFGADHVNVQPHAGSQANEAVYRAAIEVGDTMLAMNLDHGGHLTHGSPGELLGQALQGRSVRRAPGHRADRLRPGAQAGARAPPEADPCGTTRLLARSSTSRRSARSRTKSARCSSPTSRTSPASSRRACIRRRSGTRNSSRPPPTRRCAVRAAA